MFKNKLNDTNFKIETYRHLNHLKWCIYIPAIMPGWAKNDVGRSSALGFIFTVGSVVVLGILFSLLVSSDSDVLLGGLGSTMILGSIKY